MIGAKGQTPAHSTAIDEGEDGTPTSIAGARSGRLGRLGSRVSVATAQVSLWEGRGAHDTSAAWFIAAALVTFPVLVPSGPGGVTPADAMMGVALLGTLLWASTYRVGLRLPYLVPVAILVVAGSVAAMFSLVPGAGALALAQDIYVFFWAVAIANVIRLPENLSIVLAGWAWAATFWASALIIGTIASQSWLVGAPDTASRGELWFNNPNMAGGYFVLSMFVVLLSRHPRRRPARLCALLLIFFGLVLTGSNGALLALVVGGAATAIVEIWRRTDVMIALVVWILGAILVAGLVYVAVDRGIWGRIEESSNGLVERSLGRGAGSVQGREGLYLEQVELFRSGSLIGRGPASTKANLAHVGATVVKEAHDDYLAAIVERGVVGFLGLALLIADVGVMAYSVLRRRLRPAFALHLTNPSALVGGVVAMAVFATSHEILHYRYVWTFLGILAGLYLFAREPAQVGRSEAVAPLEAPAESA